MSVVIGAGPLLSECAGRFALGLDGGPVSLEIRFLGLGFLAVAGYPQVNGVEYGSCSPGVVSGVYTISYAPRQASGVE
jgi:hypothetical protein